LGNGGAVVSADLGFARAFVRLEGAGSIAPTGGGLGLRIRIAGDALTD